MKIIDPPVIVSVCLETQRRIARARARNSTGPTPPQRAPDRAPADPARDPAGTKSSCDGG